MSGVILRCPNCGTAQPKGGECEACREASVQFFCTNHDPGIWLDSDICTRCGARFGEAAPAAEAPPSLGEISEAYPPAGGSRRLEPERRPDPGPWDEGRPDRRGGPGGDPPVGPDPSGLLLAMLGTLARARRSRPERLDYEADPPAGRTGCGCFGGLLLLAFVLLALFLLAPILLGALLGFG